MLLRTRIIFYVLIACLMLGGGLTLNDYYNQNFLKNSFQEDLLESYKDLWKGIVKKSYSDLDYSAEKLATNKGLINDLGKKNWQKTYHQTLTILGERFKDTPLNWIAVYDVYGKLVFFSEDQKIKDNFIESNLIKFKAMENRQINFIQDLSGKPSLVASYSIGQGDNKKIVLVGYYIEHLIQSLASDSFSEIYFKDQESFSYFTDREELPFNEAEIKKDRVSELQDKGHYYDLYRWRIESVGEFFLLKDVTQLQKQNQTSFIRTFVIALVIFLIIILLLYFVLNRAMHPLKNATNVLRALIKGNTSIKPLPYKRQDEIGAVIHGIESLRKKTKEVRELQASKDTLLRIEEQLSIARSIQMNMVPRAPLLASNVSFWGFMRPAKAVGGDFYDYFMLDESHAACVIGDVSGKGMPAALFMAMAASFIKAHLKVDPSPQKCLEDVNNLLLERNPHQFFVTVFVGVLNIETGKLVYSNGGHNPPLYFNAKSNKIKALEGTMDLALGVIDNEPYRTKTYLFSEGDSLLLYTDGLSEALNKAQKEYGMKRFNAAYRAELGTHPNQFLEKILARIDQFVGGEEQFDDMTAVFLDFSQRPGKNTRTLIAPIEHLSRGVFEQLAVFFKKESLFFKGWSLQEIELSLEELIENHRLYALSSKGLSEDFIYLSFEKTAAKLSITLTLLGKKFNPFTYKAKPEEKSLETRELGGLGIKLVMSLAADYAYKYEKGANYLTLYFKASNLKG